MINLTSNIVLIEDSVDYKPKWVNKSPMYMNNPKASLENGAGSYDKPIICKFVVAVNTATSLKIWSAYADTTDDNAGVDVDPKAFVAGNEYDITVGKIVATGGTFKAYGYYTKNIPHDYSSF